MTEYGLKRRHPQEQLTLNSDLAIDPVVVRVLTHFQIEALRFLWSNIQTKEHRSCLYNDGRHMGKRITLGALLNTLLRSKGGPRILLACDSDESIVRWIFQMSVFGGPSPEYSVYSGSGHRVGDRTTTSPLTYVNFTKQQVDLNKLILQNDYKIVILDIGNATSRELQLKLDLPTTSFLIVVSSIDLTSKPRLLKGLLRFAPKAWPTLRRTNEQHLREFPWLDQRRFQVKFEDWKGQRTVQEILKQRRNVQPLTGDEDEVVQAPEESQQMSQLLFETDDEGTPVKQDLQRSNRSHLLSSMYLRISQSFATNTTPQARKIPATIAQDSPDLFASIMTDDEDDVTFSEHAIDLTREDPSHPFDKSTPLTLSSVMEMDIPSQSPVRSLPKPDFNQDHQEGEEEDMLLDNDKTDVFEITSNEVFASKIKTTTNQKYVPVEDADEQLKFSDDEEPASSRKFRTPTKGKLKSPHTSPTSSGWLSKRNTPKKPTPEKFLAKKRKSLMQFYASGRSDAFQGDLDFATLDGQTQEWA